MPSDSKEIVPLSTEAEWHEIVSRIVDELAETDHLPDKVIEATEMLIAGFPIYKIARKLGVRSDTVRRWLSQYPVMAAAVASGHTLLQKWRMAKLEQQFLTALERSQEVLEVPLSGLDEDGNRIDPKVLTVVAAQARYIIGLFAGQQLNVTVTHEMGDTVMKAKEDALAYLADRLAEQQIGASEEPIEAVYRVIDSKADDSGPMLDEDGNPPFGQLGVLDKDQEGILCHICGRRFKSFSKHLMTAHNTSSEDYETLYLLDEGTLRRVEVS